MARERGNKWQADVLINGKRQRLTFNTRSEAEAYEASFSKDSHTIDLVIPALARELWGGTKDEINCLRIADELVTILGPSMEVAKIDTPAVERLTQVLRLKKNKPRTINTKLARLSKLLKKAQRKGWVEKLPDIDLTKVTGGRIRFLTETEEGRIRDALPVLYRGVFDFLLYTGCRCGEAFDLQWQDIDQTKVTFWETKGGKPRTIPLVSYARAGVPWAKHNQLVKPFAEVTYHPFYNAFKKAREAAGLGSDKQVVPHVLRHTCASRLVQRGVDIRRVKEWLGHADISMTMRYAHLAPDDLYAAASVLEGGRQSVNLVPQALAQ